MTDQELHAAIEEGLARQAADPHAIEAEERDRHAGPFIACRCGRVFNANTFGRAVASWRHHRAAMLIRGEGPAERSR